MRNYPTFSALSTSEYALTDEMLEKIEQYVVLFHSKIFEAKQVNEARQKLFVKGTMSLCLLNIIIFV